MDAILKKIVIITVLLFAFARASNATITFTTSAQSTASTTASTTCTISITLTAGQTVLVGGLGVGNAVSSVADTLGNSYSSVAGPITNTVTSTIFGDLSIATGGATTITVTFASSSRRTCVALEYAGVIAFGQTATNTGSSTAPLVTLTTQDANNFVVAVMTRQGTSTWSSNASCTTTCTLRNNQAGAGSTTPGQGSVDVAKAAAGSTTNEATISVSGAWAAASIELRSVTPPPPTCAGTRALMGVGC